MSELETIAAAADATADEQRVVARTARRMQRDRDRGATWSEVLRRDDAAGLVARLRNSARRLRDASTALAGLLSRGLSDEGESRRTIASRLGVSHQRVTALLQSNGRMAAGDE